jgi:multidrug resistance protein, MATE family
MHQIFKQEFKHAVLDSLPNIFAKSAVGLRSFLLTWMIAKLGTHALAVSAIVTTLFALITYFFMGLFSAIAVAASHANGAGNQLEVERIIFQGLWLSTLLAIPVMLFVYNAGIILKFFIDPSLLPGVNMYLHSVTWAVLPFCWSAVLQQLLLVWRKSRVFSVILSLAFTLIVSYLLGIGGWGIKGWGLSGFGWGLTLAYSLIFITMIFIIFSDKKYRLPNWFKNIFHIDFPYIYSLWKLGWTIGLKYIVQVFIFILLALLIGRLSATALAIHQVLIQCTLLSAMFSSGIEQAVRIRVAECIGQNNSIAGRFAIISYFLWGCLLTGIASLGLILFSQVIIHLFFPHKILDSFYYHLMKELLVLAAIYQLLDGTRIIAAGVLVALKDTLYPLLVEIFYLGIVGLSVGLISVNFFHQNLSGYWIGLTVGVSLCAVFSLIRIRNLSRQPLKLSS